MAQGIERHRTSRLIVGLTRGVLLSLVTLAGSVACSPVGTEPPRSRLVIDPGSVSLYQGRADTLNATAYDDRGQVIDTYIAWSTANRQIAAVDSQGIVVANTPGQTTLTATTGLLTSTIRVTVRADSGKPQLRAIELSTPTVDLIGGDAVLSVLVRARDLESGVRFLDLSAKPSFGASPWPLTQYCMMELESGDSADGAWRCTLRFHRYTAPGPWRVVVFVSDWRAPLPNVDSSSVGFIVSNPRTDDTPPTLTELTFTEERVTEPPHEESRIMVISATDNESGMLTAEFFLDSDSVPGIYGCGAERPRPHPFPWTPVASVSGRCPVPLVASATPVPRTVSLVRLTDARGNVRLVNTEELARGGFVTRIDVRK